MAKNELYQYSTISALMEGVASSGLPIAELLAHGNHGLGTVRYMVGELIILDGTAYQMKPDGSINAIDPSTVEPGAQPAESPFAMVTHFEPQVRKQVDMEGKGDLEGGKGALAELLLAMMPGSKNHFLILRMDARFKTVTVRTVAGQTVPGQGLAELGKHQVARTFDNVAGTLIGFRSPKFMGGISVAGLHLHFISTDRTYGGHIIGFENDGPVEVSIAKASTVTLDLPRNSKNFEDASLEADLEGIAAVEG